MKVTCVIHIKMEEALTTQDLEFLYNLLFSRRKPTELPKLQTCINRLAIGTKLKVKFGEKDEILVYWKYDPYLTTLPRFKSNLVSLYEEGDIEYKKLAKDTHFQLIGVNVTRTLSAPELMYLKHQIDKYVDKKKALKEIEIFNEINH